MQCSTRLAQAGSGLSRTAQDSVLSGVPVRDCSAVPAHTGGGFVMLRGYGRLTEGVRVCPGVCAGLHAETPHHPHTDTPYAEDKRSPPHTRQSPPLPCFFTQDRGRAPITSLHTRNMTEPPAHTEQSPPSIDLHWTDPVLRTLLYTLTLPGLGKRVQDLGALTHSTHQ